MTPYWPFLQILLTSEIICKQRLFYEHKVGQFHQNCKSITFNKDNLESPYKFIKKTTKKNCSKKVRTFFTVHSIFSYFWPLNCYYFGIIFIDLLETSPYPHKTGQSSHFYHHSVRNNGPFKISKITFFGVLFQKKN